MKYSDFKKVSSEIIEKYYDDLKVIDNNLFNGKALSLKRNRLIFVYLFYEKARKKIRKLYMSEQSKPMDRHKIASNLMCAILKSKIVKVNWLVPNLSLNIMLANEYIAFYTAINIVELYKRESGNLDYQIIFPETYIKDEGENSYIENICKALYYTEHFDLGEILSYANIMFLLEKNTEYAMK